MCCNALAPPLQLQLMVKAQKNESEFSVGRDGKIVPIRMKPETHLALTRMCAERGIPMNTFLNRLIIRSIHSFDRKSGR
jgi:hypothetical protein